jgi:hypothetical protein
MSSPRIRQETTRCVIFSSPPSWFHHGGEPRIHYLPKPGLLAILAAGDKQIVVRPFDLHTHQNSSMCDMSCDASVVPVGAFRHPDPAGVKMPPSMRAKSHNDLRQKKSIPPPGTSQGAHKITTCS